MRKILFPLFTCILIFSACNNKPLFDRSAGTIRLAIDAKGRITAFEDVKKGVNYIAPDEPSFLIGLRRYVADSAAMLSYPVSARLAEENDSASVLRLFFDDGSELTVSIEPRQNYFRMKLIDASPVSQIRMISWGPYHTTMKGLFGEWLGLNRSMEFTLGLLTLEPNTDGNAARHTVYGSEMQLISYDHTRGLFIGGTNARLRRAAPIDKTVVGSSVALFGCSAGKENELDAIEKIELAENLPHPLFDGLWNKRSREGQKFCIWANYTEQNWREHLDMSKEMAARILCRPGGFFRNWGHFEINPKIYPGGIEKLREHSKIAKSEGIGLTEYTLTTFLKPNPDPEPYISPVPDDRLQTWRNRAELTSVIGISDTTLLLKNTEGVRSTLEKASVRVLRIDNEMIEFKKFKVDGDNIFATGCIRGAFYTVPAEHRAQDSIRIMYVAGYHNFYPGTLDLSNEFSDRLSDIIVVTDLDNLVVDGFESCQETGYGDYTGNVFLKNFYDSCIAHNKYELVTGSGFSAYTWHITSHTSWGEGDTERGFRGTMLDYRLYRQLQLRRNLMPYKMGQYYPDIATAEDVNWLMALITGWDSGVDFHLNLDKFRKNPEFRKINETFKLWEAARDANAFSEDQKMQLRQTDVLYRLSHKNDGGWKLEFDRFWQYDKLNVLPPSVMNARAVGGNESGIRTCSIDWKWTHNPGIYNEVGLSDDMLHVTGEKASQWLIDFPAYEESKKSWYPTSERNFQFIIRIPEDSPCSAKNFRIIVDDQVVDIPVELHPGEYISTPHILEMACIYDRDHHVIGEVYLHGKLPVVTKGKTSKVSISCEPSESGKKPQVIMNARFQNGYFHMY